MSAGQTFLSFNLPDEVFAELVDSLPDPWEGNTFGHMIFLSKYSRKKPDGTKETWGEVVRRCVEGAYSIQRDWTTSQRIPWSDTKALRSATEMFERMYTFKFTPPGRGLWMMGTEFVHEHMGSAALQNCAFVSTEGDEENFIRAAEFLMEASMLGVGVGFDTLAAGYCDISIGEVREGWTYVVQDSREGWADSVVMLLQHYLSGEDAPEAFDYSIIRPKGSPIKGFGGTAAGPDPLIELHGTIHRIFRDRNGETLTHRDVVDVMNVIGKCVVAGNVRRSAEIALGPDDKEYLHLKDYDPKTGEAFHPVAEGRVAHGWASNNSVFASAGETNYQAIQDLNLRTEGVGLFWLETSQTYGRLGDDPNNRDYRAQGTNPCSEQTLESFEMCNLVETYPSNHESKDDYLRTLKFAYLYAKSVTLLPTHWPETNAIMLRNRRIGTSVTGAFQFAEEHGLPVLREWLREGYDELQRWDTIYSEWLCIRPSIKTTSVKPSGTVSKVVKSKFKGHWYSGITPGAHAPVARSWAQHVILDSEDPVLHALQDAGYYSEPRLIACPTPGGELEWIDDPSGSMVVRIPIQGPPVRTQDEVTMWEKTSFVALLQRDWADNQVSVTIDFDPITEGPQIANLLHAFEGQLKSISFLKRQVDGEASVYPQLPMDRSFGEAELSIYRDSLVEPDFTPVYEGVDARDADGERFCDTDSCELPVG